MITKTIKQEIDNYIDGQVQISEGYNFSTYKLIKRVMLYANNIYPTGKVDRQGKYKYFFDIMSPRIDSEVKNIDFDTKDVMFFSETYKDSLPIFIGNLALKDWMKENEQSVLLNNAIEQSTGWGNIVWKKIKGGYELADLKNFYVINQTAETLEDSPVIERHILTQSDLRAKKDVWENVDDVIKTCGSKTLSTVQGQVETAKEVKYYEVYERNGEVSEKELFEAQDKEGGDEDKYLLAKIIVAGLDNTETEGSYILFADEISEMPYKEYHRGRYTGRWFRQGLYEILFDIQTRANEIGNQIARGLEWSSKTIFRSSDKLIAQNILTDMQSGDIIKSIDLQQVVTRMEGFDQLIADWNRLMQMADRLCNSYEVVTGESLPTGTPFRLGAMINQNANKLFDFIREKLSIAVESVFQDWVLPNILKDLKRKEILKITGDSEIMDRYYQMLVDGWYVQNLVSLPPHTAEDALLLKSQKVAELRSRPEQFLKIEKNFWDEFKPRVKVVIHGENVNLLADLETLSTFIALEQDPVRRQALIEMAMAKKGIDVKGLPKTPPQQLMPQQQQPQQVQQPQQKPNQKPQPKK